MNIASIMSTVLPGTFAPDMDASEAPTVSAIPGLGATALLAAPKAATDSASISSVSGETSFKDTVKQLLGSVNDSLTSSDQNVRDLASGKTNDVNKVVTSVEEANLALQYTMAIRTKLLEAYSSINQMSV
jgi:flagellar hook-basal body complex protein FliE